MSLTSKTPISTAADNNADTELGVRRALGLDGNGASQRQPQAHRPAERFTADHQKRRFVRDGEVPVVVVRGRQDHAGRSDNGTTAYPGNRVEAADAALRLERDARGRAERSLAEAQATIRDLQTKLGHAALAREEFRETVRQVDPERVVIETALAAERQAREQAESDRAKAYSSRDNAMQRLHDLQSALAIVEKPVLVEDTVSVEKSMLGEKPALVDKAPVERVRIARKLVEIIAVTLPSVGTKPVVNVSAAVEAPVVKAAKIAADEVKKTAPRKATAPASRANARAAALKPVKWWVKPKK